MDKILAEQIQENFSEYKQFMIWILLGFAILIILKGQLHSLSDLEELNESVNPQEIYGDPETEVSQISDRIKELNKNSEISTFEKDVKKMRTLVEKYFKELIK